MYFFQRNNNGKSYVLNGSAHDLILGANNSSSQLVLKSDGNVSTSGALTVTGGSRYNSSSKCYKWWKWTWYLYMEFN